MHFLRHMSKILLTLVGTMLLRTTAFAPMARPAFKQVFRAATMEASATDSDFDGFKSTKSFFFPGQGAQVVGMAKEVVDEVRFGKGT